MNLPKTPPPVPPEPQDRGLEFELTDIEEARRVLDSESMSQFDVASVDSVAHWKKVRRGTLPTDRAIGGRAIDWLLKLPEGLRPEHLSSRFPRIANALAEIWDDPGERLSSLDKLLGSERRGRKGFPPEVHHELIALRDWARGLREWDEPF